MQSDNFSPKESLLLIDSMINQAKNRFSENGFLYLLWGWLVCSCAIGHFFMLKFGWFRHPELIWASTWLVAIFQIFYLSKKKKKQQVSNYSDSIINAIWISFAICAAVIAIIVGKANQWVIMNSLVLMLYAIPTFLSGIVMKFKPLITGGIICWLLAALSAFVQPLYVLLLLALAVICAWIIPGYLLRKKFKQQNTIVQKAPQLNA